MALVARGLPRSDPHRVCRLQEGEQGAAGVPGECGCDATHAGPLHEPIEDPGEVTAAQDRHQDAGRVEAVGVIRTEAGDRRDGAGRLRAVVDKAF